MWRFLVIMWYNVTFPMCILHVDTIYKDEDFYSQCSLSLCRVWRLFWLVLVWRHCSPSERITDHFRWENQIQSSLYLESRKLIQGVSHNISPLRYRKWFSRYSPPTLLGKTSPNTRKGNSWPSLYEKTSLLAVGNTQWRRENETYALSCCQGAL